jgi:hypothetical protein
MMLDKQGRHRFIPSEDAFLEEAFLRGQGMEIRSNKKKTNFSCISSHFHSHDDDDDDACLPACLVVSAELTSCTIVLFESFGRG